MVFITFRYKIGEKSKQYYYGKAYLDYVSDDHDGLDKLVIHYLEAGLSLYKKRAIKRSSIYVGILSYSSDRYIPTYSDNPVREAKCFDFYVIEVERDLKEIVKTVYERETIAYFVNGKHVPREKPDA